MKTSERLLAASKDLFDACVRHPFVQGIGSGSLDKEKFKFYMLQDYLYLIDYTRVFAIGVAKAEDMETMKAFAGSVYNTLYGEMDIHRAYMKRLGVSEDEAENAKKSLDNSSYTAYMLRKAYEGTEADVVASILSCASSYEYIGRKLIEQYPDCDKHPFFGEWVQGYTSEEYRKEPKMLEDLLDRLTEGESEAQYQRLEDIFLTCTRYELSFWDMAWEMRK